MRWLSNNLGTYPKMDREHPKIFQAVGNPTYFLFRDQKSNTKKFWTNFEKMLSY